MSTKPDAAESGKAAFKKYLEEHGVIRQLTRVLVGLYEAPERPLNALDYIKRHLGVPTGEHEAASNRTNAVEIPGSMTLQEMHRFAMALTGFSSCAP